MPTVVDRRERWETLAMAGLSEQGGMSGRVRVVVLDVGSVKLVRRRKTGRVEKTVGWAALDASPVASGPWIPRAAGDVIDRGQDLRALVECVRAGHTRGMAIALGFECPCFVPVPTNEADVLSARRGERDRSFSASAGANALVTGLVEAAWVLEQLGGSGLRATVAPARWRRDRDLLLWEAFISGAGKRGPSDSRPEWGVIENEHVADAAAAVSAFIERGNPSMDRSDVTAEPPQVLNTLAASALRAGLSEDLAELSVPSYVLRAGR